MFNKSVSNIETINDMDGEVTNLFECIKADPERLERLIFLTPYSRQVFEDAYKRQPENNFDKAALFITRCDMGHGFRTNGENVGFKMDIQGREASYAVKHWNQIPQLIAECAHRLKQVQIENRDAISVIKRFNFENVLIYADPPYLLDTRHGKQYRCEMENADHVQLLETLNESQAKIILSGYESNLYSEMLKGWHKEEHTSRNQTNRNTKEILWMNFEPESQITFKEVI